MGNRYLNRRKSKSFPSPFHFHSSSAPLRYPFQFHSDSHSVFVFFSFFQGQPAGLPVRQEVLGFSRNHREEAGASSAQLTNVYTSVVGGQP